MGIALVCQMYVRTVELIYDLKMSICQGLICQNIRNKRCWTFCIYCSRIWMSTPLSWCYININGQLREHIVGLTEGWFGRWSVIIISICSSGHEYTCILKVFISAANLCEMWWFSGLNSLLDSRYPHLITRHLCGRFVVQTL